MKIRAIIFDVYGTLLAVQPTPFSTRQAAWESLCARFLQRPSVLTHVEFVQRCEESVRREHRIAQGRGILFPEVCWPEIIAAAFAEWDQLTPNARAAFPGAVMEVVRTLHLDRDAVAFLKECLRRRLTLGIASNAQDYTLGELDSRLRPEGLALDVFASQLIFWSFQHGFSKPNPHVFQLMTSRLANAGFRPQEVLMIGDRADNDTGPAAAFGWRTWQLPSERGAGDGGWPLLQEKLWNSNHFDL